MGAMRTIAGGALTLQLAVCRLALGDDTMKFTIYSQPIELRYGEVYNKVQVDGTQSDHMLPEDVIKRYESGEKTMAVTGFTVDIVRKTAAGEETPVKLSDHYLHHYLLYFGRINHMDKVAEAIKADQHLRHMLTGCHGMTGKGLEMLRHHLGASGVEDSENVFFGSAAGAEYRHNPQEFQAPFRLLLRRPQAWFPTFHVINTKDDNRTVSPLLECPCTPQRMIDPVAGTIDGKTPDPKFGCSPAFAETGNPSCNLSSYRGGWRCCEHNMFLIDTDKDCVLPGCAEKPVDTVFMKFTFEYEDATSETRDIESSACCDTTSNIQGDGNIEHDVPACPAGTPPNECIFVTETVQPIGYFGAPHRRHKAASDLVDLVQAAPHLHWAGLSLELIDHETNETLCEVHHTADWSGGVMYGTGDEPGNEKGYLVGLKVCTWSGKTARRFRRDHLLRARSVYNATFPHTGVMSLWLAQVAAVTGEAKKDEVMV